MTTIGPRDRPELGGSPEGEPPSDEIPLDIMREAVRAIKLWEDSDELATDLAVRLYALMRRDRREDAGERVDKR